MPGVDISPIWGRPINIQVLPRSLADHSYQASAGGLDPIPEKSRRGKRRRETQGHDLQYHGGKTIPNITFTNFYVGGDAWEPSDIENIDRSLAAAMCEPSLNNVLAQYFNTVPTGRFVQSQKLEVPVLSQFSRGDVEELVRKLQTEGKLSGFDLNCTAINFLLPRGVLLNNDPAPNGTEGDSSRHGLGGYHGSVQVDDVIIYYGVAVYSETADGETHGVPVFDAPWKNVVATSYHHLNEIRTDPDVEIVINGGPRSLLGWLSQQGEECGDFPVFMSNPLSDVFQEVPVLGGGTAPIQFIYSNYVHGPEGPIPDPHPPLLKQVAFNEPSNPGSMTTSENKEKPAWVLSEGRTNRR
jgi:hypothetical protein